MASSTPLPAPQPAQIDPEKGFLNSHPLFMTSLPDDGSNDATLAALQSLVHDGTPDEIAQNFKEQGNDYFKGRRFREALGFYTQGIDAKPEDLALMEALLCNRAACNLELKNFGSVLRDCATAIRLNQKASKAYYRSAQALLTLERIDEALDACDRCLAFDTENAGMKLLRASVMKKKEELDKKARDREERLAREAAVERKFKAALAERNIIEAPNPEGSTHPYHPHFDPEDPSSTTLIFPVFFLYPQYAITDAIPSFVEATPFTLHLESMFPPSAPPPNWDVSREYVAGALTVYAMTRRKRLLKVGKKMSLRDVCEAARAKEGEERDGLELKDGCLTFVVLPKGEEEHKWVAQFKRERGF
ncbi:hypothetical protein K488DRAFT_45503 [Vararia minispora EC-137]|uniref:Uncharacterized protein n=1 Tax=Vararia minispora EC-137 TaxID=1314806 RepID=A0ACB8QS63_9AGAM|nr:hypothetical protein K488DRAFT_45503 [Vararia minispora EC-137]